MKRLLSALFLPLLSGFTLSAQDASDTLKVHELEAVSVLGTRVTARTPMAYSNISKATLSKGNLGVDLPYLLQMQPSVVATSDAGTGVGYTALRVRGVDATGINITIGGVPINDSESQAVFWVNMPDLASSVGEIQLQRGIGTSSNGAASFGATINVMTEHLALKPYADIALSAGSYGLFRRNVRLGTGRLANHWAFDARLSKIDNKGYIDRSGVNLSSYFLQGGYFTERTIIKFLAFGGEEVTGIAWDGIDSETERTKGRRFNWAGYIGQDAQGKDKFYRNTDNYKQLHNHLYLTHRFTPLLSLNLTGHYTRGLGYTDEYKSNAKLSKYALPSYLDAHGKEIKRVDLVRRKHLDNHFFGLVSSLNWSLKQWQLSLGASANRYNGAHFGEVRWLAGYPNIVTPDNRYYDNFGRKDVVTTQLKANYHWTNALSTYIDLQYRYVGYSVNGVTDNILEASSSLQKVDISEQLHFFNPKVGLFYQLDEHHHAYASVAMASREPNRKHYLESLEEPNKYPKAERMTDYELGYGYSSSLLRLNLGAYYMYYNNQLIPTGRFSNVGEMLLENTPNSYRLGLELQTAYKALDWLRLEGAFALSRNKISKYDYTVGSEVKSYRNATIAYSPSVVASGACTLVLPNFEASLRGQYVSRQNLDNTNDVRHQLPSYTVFGLNLSYDIPMRWLKRWNISLQINNLLDRKYSSNGYGYDGMVYSYPQAGINFIFGTNISI